MDVNSITTIIGTVGFPIVCCLALVYYNLQLSKSHKDEVTQLSNVFKEEVAQITEAFNSNSSAMAEAINNNTVVMNQILEHIRKEE